MKRNKFSLSHYKLMTGDFGQLYPITWFEAMPGDSIQQRTSLLIRLSPILAPLMHPVRVRVHHWFVPFRLIWEDFEDFITGGADGNDASVVPYKAISSCAEGSLLNYLGVPYSAGFGYTLNANALPLRAYNLIYNEHYRDQDLVTALVSPVNSGADTTSTTSIKRVAWEKDYFTTARPWEQKGDDVNIPLLGDAPVSGIGNDAQNYPSTSVNAYETDGTGASVYANADTLANWYGEQDPNNTGFPNIRADLSQATGMSINDLRLYAALQRYKENRAEFGSRYVEYLLSAFGVRSSDARLQNPEYLGGGRQVIQFSEVLSTADSGTDNVGQLRGHGIAAMRTNRYRRFFEEHGIVMSLLSIVPKAIYMNGLHRSWVKTTKEEFYQKELAHVGDQAITNKEVYIDHASPDATFGYQQRYDDYRYMPSMIAGEFQSTLNYWHYARIFGSDPTLNQAFVECNPTKRQYFDNVSDVTYIMANHSIQARRPIPRYPRKRLM